MQNVIAIVNLKNILQNARLFKERTKTKLCAVVKADAYGHGAESVAFALSQAVDFFAVATETEGLKIKQAACGREILVLTPPVDERETVGLILSGLSVTVASVDGAKLLLKSVKKTGVTAYIHLKTNSGMNRYGMTARETETVCRMLKGQGQVCVQGVYSHLYGQRRKTLRKQQSMFEESAEICQKYFPNALRHLSATFGATLSKDFYYDAVRIGIGLYGYLPSGVSASVKKQLPLKKAMTVYARAAEQREYTLGGAGYGEIDRRERKKLKKSGLTVLRVGYADGFFRSKNKKSVSVLQVNDLCMDACHLHARKEKGEYAAVMIDAEETAKRAGTTAYEILCACTRRAEFIYEYE